MMLQTPKGNGGHSNYLLCTTYFQVDDDDDDDDDDDCNTKRKWSIGFSPCTADFQA
jgi:hypothetical protein